MDARRVFRWRSAERERCQNFTKGLRTKWPFRLVSATFRSSTMNCQDSVSENLVRVRSGTSSNTTSAHSSDATRHALGALVRGNLRDMRLAASKILAKARLGIDAVAEKRAAAEKQTVSLNDVVKRYLPDRKPNLRARYYAEIERQLEKDWKPLLKEPIMG